MDNVKVDLGNGDYAIMVAEVTRETFRNYRKELFKSGKTKEIFNKETDEVTQAYDATPNDVDDASDAILLGNLIELNIGGKEMPLKIETLNKLSQSKFDTLMVEALKTIKKKEEEKKSSLKESEK